MQAFTHSLHSPHRLSRIRRFALNILNRELTFKVRDCAIANIYVAQRFPLVDRIKRFGFANASRTP